MNRPSLIAILALACVASPALAAGVDAAAINGADFGASKALSDDRISPLVVKLQVVLDRARFSPGEIDGKLGEIAQKALKAFSDAEGLSPKRPLTDEVWKALAATSSDAVITEYKIAQDDVKGPFLEKLPPKIEEMKDLAALSYTSPREALGEKFHMSEDLLEALNPRQKFDQAGDTIFVANVPKNDPKLKVGRIEVDKELQTLKAFAPSGRLVAFFPATLGSDEKPTPSGTLKVESSDANPNYRYRPDYKFKGVNSKEMFDIKPGPNNPAGSYWIGRSAEGYGIHGMPNPSKVSKTESHGCVRLTNWDVTLLGRSVKKGTPVTFVEPPQAGRKS
jgi:lipoprotein-anchoring transpeptidase ErfK/SrfK